MACFKADDRPGKEGGEPIFAEDRLIPIYRNGSLKDVYWTFSFSPLRGVEERVEGVLVVCSETTEIIRFKSAIEEAVAERTRELDDANKRLQQSNEELAQYAYVASHDLQEPLRKIRIFTTLLRKEQLAGANSELLLDKVCSAADRMSSLINDVLEYSRLLKSEKQFTAVDLGVVANAVAIDFELAIKESGATIIIGDLPIVLAISLQMNQLFCNLFSNALKFRKPNTPLTIEVYATPASRLEAGKHVLQTSPSAQHHIIFKDNGIGFEQEYAEQVFEVFKRLHTREVYPGSGIGLALCRRIIVNHHGGLYVDSAPDEGSAFSIILPAQ